MKINSGVAMVTDMSLRTSP